MTNIAPPAPGPEQQNTIVAPRRQLTHVLLKTTLSLAFLLGLFAALLQLWLDLNQQKNAVEISAEEFLASVVPSAASAAYNYQNEAAAEVARGLFSQRAIQNVVIYNEGEVMVARSRTIEPTLPRFLPVTEADKIEISRPLLIPGTQDEGEVIGSIVITVDRSVVSPSIVDRMMSYFTLALLKNFAFGLLLVLVVYGALARHLVRLTDVASEWDPDVDNLVVPAPPKFLSGTEVDILGQRIAQLGRSAREVIRLKSEREVQLSNQSDELQKMVRERTLELERANQKLKRAADHDGLTQILNRGALDRVMAEAFDEARISGDGLAIALIDIDNFKSFNDTYGHQEGDTALIAIAGAIGQIADENNAVLGRYGGEEFALFKPGLSAIEMVDVCRAIHTAVANLQIEHVRSRNENRITVSIGVAAYSASEHALDFIIREADQALYRAKSEGRNRTCHGNSPENGGPQDLQLGSFQVLRSLKLQRYEPFFQPQIDANTGQLVGAEILSRMHIADNTYVTPDKFLPDIMDAGMLTVLDRIIIEKVGQMLRQGKDRNLPFPKLSLNTHPEALKDKPLLQSIIGLSQIGPARIAVELLETWSFEEIDPEMEWGLDALREAGIDIEIDDFGTSQASLLSVHRIQPDGIKIARELVAPLPGSETFRWTVRHVLELAHHLSITAIAEGVETTEQASELIAMGCNVHQGFLYSKPIPERAFLPLVGQLRTKLATG